MSSAIIQSATETELQEEIPLSISNILFKGGNYFGEKKVKKSD